MEKYVKSKVYFVIALISPLFLTGCMEFTTYWDDAGRHHFLTPAPLFMPDLPDGDDSYSQGCRDGCHTALGVVGSGMVRAAHDFEMDVTRAIEDKMYYKGYKDCESYCVYYTDYNPL